MAELPKGMIFHYYSEDGITIKVDAVPLVRCGECKWHNDRRRCVNFDAYFNDDFYCAYGERRTDDE